MPRNRLLLVLSALLFAGVLQADDFRPATVEELAMKDVAGSPGAPAVLLDWNVRHDDIDSSATEYLRIKVLTEEGKKYGDIELVSIPQFQQVRSIKARTIAPNGTATEFKGKIYDKIIVKRGGLRVIQKTLTLPNVQPGSIIEYRYTVEWPETQLRSNRWHVQREIPIRRASFWIRPWSQGVSTRYLTKGLPPDMAPKRVRDHFEFEVDNVPAFESEPYSPLEDDLKPRIEFFYTKSDPDQYWADTAKEFGRWMEDYIGNRAGIRKAAADITAGATSPDEKLRKIYARVQTIRNLSYEVEKTEQEEKRAKLRDNNHIEDVLTRGYGYAGQLNRLFAGLARAAGFDAQMVLVPSRQETMFSQQLPDAEPLSSEIVVVNEGGRERYFDPGTPYLHFGLIHWENSVVTGLRLKPKKAWDWIKTPDQPSSAAITSRTADLHLVDGVVKGVAAVTWRGQEAVTRRLSAMNEDEAANRKTFEDDIKTMFPDGSSVKLTKIDLQGVDQPLVATFDVELPNLGTLAGSRALVPMSLFESASKNPFSGEKRKYPIYFPYQHEIEDKIRLHVPDGYTVESLPKPVRLDLGGLTYVANHAVDGKAIVLDRKLTIETIIVGSEHYQTIRKFYGALVTADHDTVVLRKAKS